MNFIISAETDIGTIKKTNQDSVTVKVIKTGLGRMVFALLCDGMGGLEEGEVASAAVIQAFNDWVMNSLPVLCTGPIRETELYSQWEKLVQEQNERIKNYGARKGIRLGTTAVAMLITQTRYFVMNIGDSRAYEITDGMTQLTNDQTFVAREVSLGHMTEEEAEKDSRRSVLLQCIGASDAVYPEFTTGDTVCGAVYMLCSDGFRHEITPTEIFYSLQPGCLYSEQDMTAASRQLIELDKQRMERDNITVALVRTF